jgi:hypothetical protein
MFSPLPAEVVELVELVYELLDAHDDTAELASDYGEESWELHLDYLRSLQRRAREILARATPQEQVQ